VTPLTNRTFKSEIGLRAAFEIVNTEGRFPTLGLALRLPIEKGIHATLEWATRATWAPSKRHVNHQMILRSKVHCLVGSDIVESRLKALYDILDDINYHLQWGVPKKLEYTGFMGGADYYLGRPAEDCDTLQLHVLSDLEHRRYDDGSGLEEEEWLIELSVKIIGEERPYPRGEKIRPEGEIEPGVRWENHWNDSVVVEATKWRQTYDRSKAFEAQCKANEKLSWEINSYKATLKQREIVIDRLKRHVSDTDAHLRNARDQIALLADLNACEALAPSKALQAENARLVRENRVKSSELRVANMKLRERQGADQEMAEFVSSDMRHIIEREEGK